MALPVQTSKAGTYDTADLINTCFTVLTAVLSYVVANQDAVSNFLISEHVAPALASTLVFLFVTAAKQFITDYSIATQPVQPVPAPTEIPTV